MRPQDRTARLNWPLLQPRPMSGYSDHLRTQLAEKGRSGSETHTIDEHDIKRRVDCRRNLIHVKLLQIGKVGKLFQIARERNRVLMCRLRDVIDRVIELLETRNRNCRIAARVNRHS